MPIIELPDDQYDKLTSVAKAAGYPDATAFVIALAGTPVDQLEDTPSEEDLSESLKMIRESEADIEAGQFRDMREAMKQIAQKHGYDIPS